MSVETSSSAAPSYAPADQGWVERAFPTAPNTIEVAQPDERTSPFPVRRFEIVRPHGAGFREFARPSDDLHLMLSDFHYDRDVTGKAEGHDFLKFHFKLSGHNLVRFGGGHDYLIDSGKSVIAYHPHGLLKDDCHAGGARECSLTLSCKPAVLLDLMRVQPEDLPAPLSSYFAAQSPDFFCHTLPLTREMVETIGAIMRPRYGGHLRRLHVEARSLDLICMMFDTLSASDGADLPSQKLRAKDVEALRAIRAFLAEHYLSPPSIPALARRFGLNRTKLTEGFRLAFGETVFNYVHSVRMQKAKELLLETDLPIALVAGKVGYERQTSFATAFRAHYGFSPRALKKLHGRADNPSDVAETTAFRPDR